MNVSRALDSTIPHAGAAHGGLAVLADPADVKRGMRERIRSERHGRTAEERVADAVDLVRVAMEQPEIAGARCLALYVSPPEAPGTAPLRQALRARGVRVLLPVALDDGHLDWTVEGGGAPTAPRAGALLGVDGLRQARTVIVPALAVDSLGNRLGEGTGLYDRALRRVSPTAAVFAVVHESEVLDAAIEPVPVERHDLPVDAVLTPRRCLRLPPHRWC